MITPLVFWSILTNGFQAGPQPNIILIVADDLGWNDVGWNNPKMITPNLDMLASDGIKLTSSYTLPLCSPSRGALLTGYYPFRLGLQNGVIRPGSPHGLPLDKRVLSEELKNLNYATHLIGKWHLGYCAWKYTPTHRGYDSFFGFYTGNIDYFKHTSRQHANQDKNSDFENEYEYSTLLFGRKAAEVIANHNKTQPMFLHLSFNAPHTPLQAPARYENMFSHIMNKNRRTYSGMVTAMDDAVGMVIDALKGRNMINNTLIVFTSDNGATPFGGGSNWPLRGGKSTVWEGGTRVPTFIWGDLLKKRGTSNSRLFHVVDWFPTLLSAAGAQYAGHELDGVNQWDMLHRGYNSPRKEFVYNINGAKMALRFGNYKLIVGSPGYYSRAYQDPSDKSDFLRPPKLKDDYLYAHPLLFNIKDDPREIFNLAQKKPYLVKTMLRKLKWYRSRRIKPPSKIEQSASQAGQYSLFPGWC